MAKRKDLQKDMFRLNKYKLNENGLTLIELLVVITLMSIISISTISLIVQSNETAGRVQIESNFRDEADLIISQLIKTLYETKQSHIIENKTDANNSFLNITTSPSQCKKGENGAFILDTACMGTLQPVGFKTINGQTKLYIKNEVYEVTNKNISILKESRINGDPKTQNYYEIVLKLEYVSNRGISKQMEFRNIIRPF